MNRINDGTSDGVMVTGFEPYFDCIASFEQNTFLREIRFTGGQFNGGYNIPTSLEIFDSDSNSLYSTNLSDNTSEQIFDVSNEPNLRDWHYLSLTFRFYGSGGNTISVRELILYGVQV
jgi:hypothetical protein